MPNSPDTLDLLRGAINALLKAVPVAADPAPLEAALVTLMRQLEGIPPRVRRRNLHRPPDHVMVRLRSMVEANGYSATAREIGVSRPTLKRIIKEGSAAFLQVAAVLRAFDAVGSEIEPAEGDIAEERGVEVSEQDVQDLMLEVLARAIADGCTPADVLARANIEDPASADAAAIGRLREVLAS